MRRIGFEEAVARTTRLSSLEKEEGSFGRLRVPQDDVFCVFGLRKQVNLPSAAREIKGAAHGTDLAATRLYAIFMRRLSLV